jgi:3',5'-cyclic AMP phosphodiesterase CpdA
MRIAHVTDIHVMVPPGLRDVSFKRLLGSANLYLAGRRKHFSWEVQQALVTHVGSQKPDAIVCTGDVTAQATEAEFEKAYGLLGALFSNQPTVVIPGNHDTYTRRTWKERAIERHFGQWTGDDPWPRVYRINDELTVVAIDTCRAHFLSSGHIPEDELLRLDKVLTEESKHAKHLLFALHYPLRNRSGEPYGPPGRALDNARSLEAILNNHGTAITAILHGHEHHGFKTALATHTKAIPILNPGASGYAWLPDRGRTAHYNIYTLDNGSLDIERFTYNGHSDAFEPEKDGAYSSGG